MAEENVDSGMTVGLEGELISSLTNRLKKEPTFDPSLLSEVVKDVIEEVKGIRNYPSYYTEKMVNEDLCKHKGKIKKIILYDYGKDGADGETSHSENGTSRIYEDRNSLFAGILRLARL